MHVQRSLLIGSQKHKREPKGLGVNLVRARCYLAAGDAVIASQLADK